MGKESKRTDLCACFCDFVLFFSNYFVCLFPKFSNSINQANYPERKMKFNNKQKKARPDLVLILLSQ